MQNRLDFASAQSTKEAHRPSSANVTILFGDVLAGQHAMRVLASISSNTTEGIDFRPQLWGFDLLNDPDWFSIALADAMNSEMIIVATTSADLLNTSVRKWIKLWVTRKENTDSALIALLGRPEEPDGPESQRYRFLQNTAGELGLDFFAPAVEKANPTPTPKSLRPEMVKQSFGNFQQRANSAPRWGINE